MKTDGISILCVDDDDDTCEMLEAMLNHEGYEVVTAQSMARALQVARTRKCSLYLIDNWLPDGSGVELTKQIRIFDPDTPILFCSGAAYESDIEAALNAGAQGYVVKPLGLEDLTQRISRLLVSTNHRRCLIP